MKKYCVAVAFLKYFVFFLLLVCYFLQAPFRFLAGFISVFALLLALLTWKKWVKIFFDPLFCLYGLYISFCILTAGFNSDTQISKTARFTEILLMIPLFFCIDESKDGSIYSKILVRTAFLKAVFLFIIFGIVLKAGNTSVIRHYSIAQGWGDIYTLGSTFSTRIQLQGNALLVMACFAAFYNKDRLIYRIALFLACLVSGNKAFFIGILLFILYFCFRWLFSTKKTYNFNFKLCALTLCFLVAFPVLTYKVNAILEEKAGYSNVVRYEQAEVLMTGNIVTGNGIGNSIKARTAHRNYDGSNYYELQTLYIINQIGVAGYLLFLLLTFSLCLKIKNPLFICYVYFAYLAYAFFNPYCFDTTHMISGFLLCTVFSKKRKEKI